MRLTGPPQPGPTPESPLRVHTSNPARHAGSDSILPPALQARLRAELQRRRTANRRYLHQIVQHNVEQHHAKWRRVLHDSARLGGARLLDLSGFRASFRVTFAPCGPPTLEPWSAARQAVSQATAQRVRGEDIVRDVDRRHARLSEGPSGLKRPG